MTGDTLIARAAWSLFDALDARVREHGVQLHEVRLHRDGELRIALVLEETYGCVSFDAILRLMSDEAAREDLLEMELVRQAEVIRSVAAAGPDAFHMTRGARCPTCRWPIVAIKLHAREFICRTDAVTCPWPAKAFITTPSGPKFLEAKPR